MQEYLVHAPTRSDSITTALCHAYGEMLASPAALDDLLHVLNWVDVPER